MRSPESPSPGPPIWCPATAAWRTAPRVARLVRARRRRPDARCARRSAPRPTSISLFARAPDGDAQRRRRRCSSADCRGRRDGAGHGPADRARRADVRGRVRARTCCSTGSAPTTTRRAASRCSGRSATTWYISGLGRLPADRAARIFTRRSDADQRDARSLQEIAILGPVVVGAVASTSKSPGRTCARGGRRRPSAAAGDTGGTSDRRGRRAAR